MGRSKDSYIDAHEELIAEMLEENPNMSEADAYARTADNAHGRMTQNWAEYADYLKDREKDEQCLAQHKLST